MNNKIQNWLLSAPCPEPNRSRPSNIIGNNAIFPCRNVPAANVEEPMRDKNENKKTPTVIDNILFKRAH